MSRRLDRLNEQLKREIAQKIRMDLRDPRVGFVTVTAVRVSPDLAYAKVLVRIAGDDKQVQDGLDGLAASGPWLRRALGAELHIRRAPELDFEIDQTLDNALRIEAILDEVRPEDGWEADPDSEGDVGSEAEETSLPFDPDREPA